MTLVLISGCPQLSPVERQAYNLFTGTKASLVQYRSTHTECAPFDSVTGLSSHVEIKACADNNRITSGKDALIDAAEVYCSGKDFEANGACNPPNKTDPLFPQAKAKLQAAIDSLNQITKDVKGTVKP